LYEELARIFSEENNQSAQRELLMKEGTAKFAQTVGENDRQMQKVLQKQASHSNVRETQLAVSWLFSKRYPSLCAYCGYLNRSSVTEQSLIWGLF
jgi:hypothetical protein